MIFQPNLIDIDVTSHIGCLIDSRREHSLLFRRSLRGDVLLAVLVQMFRRFRTAVDQNLRKEVLARVYVSIITVIRTSFRGLT
jgi:hypothetical protein